MDEVASRLEGMCLLDHCPPRTLVEEGIPPPREAEYQVLSVGIYE